MGKPPPPAALQFFGRNIAQVLSGSVAAQAVQLLGAVVIARLFAPDTFGLFSAWLGIVMLLAVVVTGRFEMALAIEPDGEPRRRGVVATFWTIWLATAALALVVGVAGVAFAWPPQVQLPMVLLAVVATALVGMIHTWQAWAAAEGRYRELSWIRVSQAVVVISGQITAGLLAPTALGMMAGQVLGLVCAVWIAASLMPAQVLRRHGWDTSWREVQSFWRKHRRFPAIALPADAINAASAQLPLLFIAARFGAEAGGLFALTLRVLGAPISLIAAAILDVFKRDAAASYRERGHCLDEYKRTFGLLAIGSIVLALGVIVTADWLFVLAFGEPWRRAGTMAIWLLPLFAMRFVASPLSYVFYIAGRQHVDLVWQCALLVMTLAAFQLVSGLEASIHAYAWGYGALYAVYAYLSYVFSRGRST